MLTILNKIGLNSILLV